MCCCSHWLARAWCICTAYSKAIRTFTSKRERMFGLNAVGIAQAINQIVADHNPSRFKWHKSCGCCCKTG